MSIYPKKNPRGQLTGKYLVEVTFEGKRYRGTAASLKEARNLEDTLGRAVEPTGESNPIPATPIAQPGKYLLCDLQRDARVVWVGNKDERTSLRQFDTCCALLGIATEVKSVRTLQLDHLVEDLRERGYSNNTIHRYLAAMSAALRWAHKRDLIDGMPHVPWPEPGRGRDATFSEYNQERLLVWLETNGHDEVYTIYRVLFATGMRIGELLKLTSPDIDCVNQTVTLRDTKNGEDRTVPLDGELARKLEAITWDGLPSYQRIRRTIERAKAALKITTSITPHVVRHTVVTRLEAEGVGLKTIGALVGHKNIATTARYAHPQQATLRAATAKLKR